MAYAIIETEDVLRIGEQRYGTARTVRFTNFTSCIGLLGRNGNNVTGVHLVIVSETGELFDDEAANTAVAKLGSYSQVVVIGLTDIWGNPAARDLYAAYQYLLAQLRSPVVIEVDSGSYGGRVHNGVFETFYGGAFHPVP